MNTEGFIIKGVTFLLPLFEALLKASLMFPEPEFKVYALNRAYVGKHRRIR